MLAISFLAYAVLAMLRPHLAVGALLCSIPFGHLVRFTVVGIPFTFPEAATYVFAGMWCLRAVSASFRAPTDSRGEKSHLLVPQGHGVRSLALLGITRWWRDPWVVLPALWVIIAAVSATYSPHALRAWGMWKAYFVAPVILFWVVRAILHPSLPPAPPSPRGGEGGYGGAGFRTTMVPLVLGAFIVAALAIVQRWWPIGVPYPWDQLGRFRATSVFGYPNAVGLYLAPLVPLLIGVALFFRSSSRAERSGVERSHKMVPASRGVRFLASLGMTTAAVLAIVAIAFARSTGALVALTLVLPVFLFFAWRFGTQQMRPTHFGDRGNRWGVGWVARARGRGAVGTVLMWMCASLVLTAWLPYMHEQPKWGPPVVQEFTFQKWSGTVRLSQYRETWQLLRDHPIRGAGLAGYQQAIRPYHEDPRVEIFLYPHNLLLAVWVELGLTGLFVFLAILYQFFRRALQLSSSPALQFAITASILVILVHGLVDVPYFKNDLAMLFWVIVAIGTIPAALGTISPYGESAAGGLHSRAPSDR